MTGAPRPRGLLSWQSQIFIADLGASLGQRYTDYKNNNFRQDRVRMGCKAGAERRTEGNHHRGSQRTWCAWKLPDWIELPKLVTTPIWVDPLVTYAPAVRPDGSRNV